MHVRENVTQPADPSYRLIALTKGQVCKVDAVDFEWLNQWKWCATWMKNTSSFYATRSIKKPTAKRGTILMSRVIMNPAPGVLVDHQNRDTLDNRRSNLRNATTFQNAWNAKCRKDSLTGIKGVSFYKDRGKWVAYVKVDRKNKYLGLFETPELAKAARDAKIASLHGEFSFFS